MDWNEFQDYWAANFGYPINENDGLSEWRPFIAAIRQPDMFRAAMRPLEERYAQEMELKLRANPPRLASVRAAWRKALGERVEQKRSAQRLSPDGSVCGVCGGSGLVAVLAPKCAADRDELWPPDSDTIAAADYRGIEITPCPQCFGDRYAPLVRQRVLSRCVPDVRRNELIDRVIGRAG